MPRYIDADELLECMTEKVNGGEPQGELTAEEVMNIVRMDGGKQE